MVSLLLSLVSAVTVLMGLTATGDSPLGKTPLSVVTLLIEGNDVTISVPEGWSIDEANRRLLPPDPMRPFCRCGYTVAPGTFREEQAQRIDQDRRAARTTLQSEVYHAGDAEAVSVQYVDREGERVVKKYIRLASDAGDHLLIWRIDGNGPVAGKCEILGGLVHVKKHRTEPRTSTQ